MHRLALLPLLLLACDVETEEDTIRFEAQDRDEMLRAPPRYGGCGDMTMYGANTTDTQAVFFNIPGLAQDAANAGRTITRTIALPSADASVTYETGRRLTSATCVGAFPWPGPSVRQTYSAVGGTLTVRATPTSPPGGMPTATVDLTLTNPSFASPAGVGFGFVGTIDLRGVDVGLYPP